MNDTLRVSILRSPWLTVTIIVLAGLIGAALMVFPPIIVLAALVGAVAGIIILRRPVWGIYAVAFVLPFERIGALDIGMVTIRASQVLVSITILAWLARGVINHRLPRKPFPLALPLALFILVNVLALVNAVNMPRSLSVLFFTVFTIAVTAFVPQMVTTRDILRKTLIALLAGAAVVSLFGLFQFVGDIIGLPTSVTGLRELYTKAVFGFPRIQSTALEPLYFANYLLIPFGIVYAFFLSRTSPVPRPLLLGLLMLFGVNIVLTVSRGGYLALAALLVVVTVLSFRQFLRPRAIGTLIISAVVVWVLAVQFLGFGDVFRLNLETFTSHVQNVFFGAAFSERVDTIETALTAWHSHPIIGIGPGAFGPYASIHPFVVSEDGWKIVNNEVIELLAETGILGLLAIGAAMIVLFVRSIGAWRIAQHPHQRAILIGLTATIVGFIVQYQTFSTLYVFPIWFTIGLVVAVQNLIFERS